jgi:uncharacterized protein (DUF608 family)
MNRRQFSAISLLELGRLATSPLRLLGRPAPGGNSGRLFPADLPAADWREFPAAGFRKPACGIVYRRGRRPRNGVPLGAIDTGRIDLQPDGTLGFCTLYNSICPQRGPLDLPFLGMTAGNQLWILSQPPGTFGEYMFNGLQIPTEIDYWGHYPVADLEFEMPGSPVGVGLRAWAPFLPGDAAASNTPGAVFDLHLRNLTRSPQQGRIAFHFPGPTQAEAQISTHSPREKIPFVPYGHTWIPTAPGKTRAIRDTVRGEFSGLAVHSEKEPAIGYALGAVGDLDVATGGGLYFADSPYKTGQTWSQIGSRLPPADENDFSGSISVAYELKPDEEKVVRLVLAWFAPQWIGEGEHTFSHMYAARYKDALDVARFLSREHDTLLARVLGWQEAIYGEGRLPVWLREALVNILYLFPVNSLWAEARPPVGPWCRPEDGLFGMLDGIVEDPAMEPIPDTFYANAPLVYFFPELALSTLRGYKAYQFSNGAAVWIWGGVVGAALGGYEMTAGTELAMPTPGYQTTTNGPCYVDMVDRYLLRTGNPEILREFYPSIKANTLYTMNLRPEDGPDGIVSVPSRNVDPENPAGQPGHHLEWFENVLWFGMTPHVGGIHLANLKMAERMAERAGDQAFARQCRAWFEQGSASLEDKLWAGEYYLAYNDPRAGKKSDDVFAYQLDGEWMARFHGLREVFRPARLKTALATIRRACAEKWPAGAVNLARPDGQLAEGVGYGPNAYFVPEIYMLAMTYMYAGERDFGLELARRCVHSLNIRNLLTWNQPNILRADNGDMLFGSHYVQNMMLWAVPAALAGQDIAAFCAPGGLVDRVIRAAKGGIA